MINDDNKTSGAKSKSNLENDQMYKRIKAQEMINRVKEKIESNDPAVLRTIKTFLDETAKKKEPTKKK
jgi:hypothetical protein